MINYFEFCILNSELMADYKMINYESRYFEKLNAFWNAAGLGGSHRGDTAAIINGTIEAGGHLILMVDSNDEIIGSSWLTNDKRRTYLHHFGIREDMRNKGLAKKLLNESLALAKTDGYQVKLEVGRGNIAAINLYKNNGFNDLGDYEVLIIRDITSIS